MPLPHYAEIADLLRARDAGDLPEPAQRGGGISSLTTPSRPEIDDFLTAYEARKHKERQMRAAFEQECG